MTDLDIKNEIRRLTGIKTRCMWMGGVVPLGYDIEDRKLVVNDVDAATVRLIFARYLALGSVLAPQAELVAAHIRSKPRTSRAGKVYGNAPFSRGALYLMLRNRIYLGEICLKGTAYPGEHRAVIDRALFTAAAAQLDQNRRDHRAGIDCEHPSLLTGLVWDGEAHRMTPSHATKDSKRYRYYVSRIDPAAPRRPTWRVPAGDLEAVILGKLRGLAGDVSNRLEVQTIVARIVIHRNRIELHLTAQARAIAANHPARNAGPARQGAADCGAA